MRLPRIQTICLFLFIILVISGIVRPRAAESLTSIDEHNRFILNGEPFFPIGLYVVQFLSDTSQLDEIASSPFDTLMNYNVNSGDDTEITNYLDQLESRNLKLIFSLAEYFDGGQPATATWTFTVAVDGSYNVYAYWKASSNRATDAPYTVNYDGGSKTVRVNQEIYGSQWNLLGTFPFVSTTPGSIVLGNDADEYVIADAIKVEGGTDIILDEEQASYVGSWTYVSPDTAAYEDDHRWHARDDIAAITHKVSTFRTHPAVISWYLNDERDPSTYLTQLEERYAKIRELDDDHPVWSVHWNTDWLLPEAHTTDILGMDSYPIDNNPITVVSLVADAAAEVGAQTDKPFWFVPQIFSWEDGRGDPAGRDLTGRPPTREEIRAMTYLAVNHGAKGVIYYSYFNILDDPDYDTRWPEIKEIAGEIDQLRPVFLSTYQTDDNDIVCNNDNIDFKLMREGNTYYLFAVNTKAPSKIIVDNPDATYGGDWPTVQGDPLGIPPTYPYGGNFQENTIPADGDTATWTPNITQAGDYRVYARWTADTTDGATNAPYTINYDGGSEQVTVNQQANGDRWILLGTYRFTAGTSGSVVLTDNANGVVIADAVMWLLKEGDVTSASFQIDLAEIPAELYTRFEDGRRLSVTNGEFTDGFNPYEVHVYYWEEPESDGGGGGSSSGCFIATAAYGSYMNPHVQVIKDFRDEYLLTNMPGRWFVGMYNTYGPFWADLLNAHPSCKPFVRLALMPVVGISYFALNTSLATKLLTGLLLMGLVVICVLRVHCRPATCSQDSGSTR